MASRTPARMTTDPPPPAAGTCDASMADGTNLFGPCILRHRHDGPVHKDSTGTRWALPDRSGDPVLASRSRELAELRAQLEQAEDLLRVAHETSNRSEAERASAVRRAEPAEERRDELAATLHDVLRHFTQKGHPGEPCLQTGWIAEKTVARWRAVLNPPATKEQPDAR